MQRNIAYKNFIDYLLWTVGYTVYLSFSTIYLLLPPLLSVLLILFHNGLKKNNSLLVLFLFFAMLIVEAQEGFLGFTLVIYFLIVHRFILPKIDQSFNLRVVRNFLYVVVSYIGYIFFSALLSQIFLLSGISINFYIVYYIAIEYILVSIFL